MDPYDQITALEDELQRNAPAQFQTELAFYREMINDVLAPIERGGLQVPDDDQRVAQPMLIARFVNDCEAARRLLLSGLGEQANFAMRDAVETGLLIVLFTLDGKRATRWMKNLAEYRVANVVKALRDEHGLDMPLNALYQSLSQLCHPNFLASLHVVEEVDIEGADAFLRTYHFGGYGNYGFMRSQWRTLLTLMMAVILMALPSPYAAYDPEFTAWWKKMKAWPDRLREGLGLNIEIDAPSGEGIDPEMLRRISVKLRVDLFDPGNDSDAAGGTSSA